MYPRNGRVSTCGHCFLSVNQNSEQCGPSSLSLVCKVYRAPRKRREHEIEEEAPHKEILPTHTLPGDHRQHPWYPCPSFRSMWSPGTNHQARSHSEPHSPSLSRANSSSWSLYHRGLVDLFVRQPAQWLQSSRDSPHG